MEAEGTSPEQMDHALARVTDESLLWEIAERVVGDVAILGAIYRHAQLIGASSDTARGYLALAHLLQGDDRSARALIGSEAPASRAPVLLDAWTALSSDVVERISRLKQALGIAPDSVRLWRALGTEALRASDLEAARTAHLWLVDHDPNPKEVKRIKGILREYGWQ